MIDKNTPNIKNKGKKGDSLYRSERKRQQWDENKEREKKKKQIAFKADKTRKKTPTFFV